MPYLFSVSEKLYFSVIYCQNILIYDSNVFNGISLNENGWIANNISLKFVSKGPFNNIIAIDQIMA